MAREYLNVMTTYGIYAKTLWHDAEPGGYWGDGIEAKNQNGAVRGMSNTLLTYVMLARGLDHGWIAPEDRDLLTSAGLTRAELMRYAKAQLDYLVAHHKSTQPAMQPQWGFWWQSPLWLGASGPAAMLAWDDLSPQERDGITSVAASEADRIATIPPKDYVVKAGDTGAEENGWNTAAPALALALAPTDARAENWWRALRVYAVNTYSHPSDRTSTATVGTDKVSEIVSTSNLLPDWTLFNHGFFHPDYVQVSGQHLGEAWLILSLGDKLHGTHRAEAFRPYALHHVRDVWEKIARPLLLPSGEFAFPNGNDWTFHCSTIQSYLAYIATALGDQTAADAEREGIKHAQRRRAVSPPGRLLGDSNLEWWWEPLVCKRACTALLHHELAADSARKTEPQRHKDTEQMAQTCFYPDAKVSLFKSDTYLLTAAWGSRHMICFYPLHDEAPDGMYTTLPVSGELMHAGITTASVLNLGEQGTSRALSAIYFTGTSNTISALVALPSSVILYSNQILGPLAIENDTLTPIGRTIYLSSGNRHVSKGDKSGPLKVDSNWIGVESFLTLISSGNIVYKPAAVAKLKSVVADAIEQTSAPVFCQLIPRSNPSSVSGAINSDVLTAVEEFHVKDSSIEVKDGADGAKYHIEVDLTLGGISTTPIRIRQERSQD